MALQRRRKKFHRYNQLSNTLSQLIASILRSHFWLRKASEPVGQIVDCCTTGWTLHAVVALGLFPRFALLVMSFAKVPDVALQDDACNNIDSSVIEPINAVS